MADAIQFDGVELSEATDFVGFARRALLWQLGGSLPWDNSPFGWIERLFAAVAGTPYPERFAAGVSACLTDEDPQVRHGAVMFYEMYPRAVGGERIVELVRGDRAGFRGVMEPHDLEHALLHALGVRIVGGDAQALELGKAELLAATGKPTAVTAAVTSADPDWVVAHAEEIVARTPATASIMLYNLAGTRHDLGEVGVRIVASAVRDPDFAAQVTRLLDDDQAKSRILAEVVRAAGPRG